MNALPPEVTVLLFRRSDTVDPEWAWGQMLCEKFLRQGIGDGRLQVLQSASPLTVEVALKTTQSPSIGVVLDDDVFWSPVGWDTLQQVLARAPHIGAVGPVSNEAEVAQQRMAPPFLYQTPWLLHLASREHHQRYQGQWQEVSALDPFAFLMRRADLEELDPQLPLTQVPASLSAQGKTLAIALDTYVHRYGLVYEQPRPDLQAQVPPEARVILDVGCATGALGAALKARQNCLVVGIETNPLLAPVAAQRLDRVIADDVEAISLSAFAGEFDCIVCGDVLEHLRDPWVAVAKFALWLKPKGRLIATLPNVGHWSIVIDLLQGRWDLVPFGLLCWGHLRFFTRAGIENLCTRNGLEIEWLQGLTDELPPVGDAFIRQAVALVSGVDQESLRTHEFLVVARKREQ